jgi:hypothetical protein
MIAAVLIVLVPGWGVLPITAPPAVHAFNPPVHKSIFNLAIGDKFGPWARLEVERGIERSDIPTGHLNPEWHFDSAKNRYEVCDLWKAGAKALLSQAVEAAMQAPTDKFGQFRRQALSFYGQYVHAFHDFYSHSNWIELQVAANASPQVAYIVADCKPEQLTENLTTGYFSVWYGLSGCPSAGPPAGFAYCHGPATDPTQQLAKDDPDKNHGGERVPNSSMTYHEMAVQLAMETTTETFGVFKNAVVQGMGNSFPDRNAECLFTWLVEADDVPAPACPKNATRYATTGAATTFLSVLGIVGQVHTFQAQIEVDPGTMKISGGSLSFEVYHTPCAGCRYVFESSRGYQSTSTENVVEFSGTATTYPSLTPGQGAPTNTAPDAIYGFSFAFNDGGQLVFCTPTDAHPADDEARRSDCLAHPVAFLDAVA